MVLNSLRWLNFGLCHANTQGSLPRSPPLKGRSAAQRGCASSFTPPSSPCHSFQWELGSDRLVSEHGQSVPPSARKHWACVSCEFSGMKSIFFLWVWTALCSLAGPYTQPYPPRNINTGELYLAHTGKAHKSGVVAHNTVQQCLANVEYYPKLLLLLKGPKKLLDLS